MGRASYAAPMSLLNGILTAVGHHDRRRSMELLEKATEGNARGFRWFEE